MKTTLFTVLLLLAASPAFADPPDEDVLRPFIGGRSGLYAQFDLGLNLTFLNGNPYVRPLMTSYEQETALYRSALGLGPLVSLSIGYEFSSHFGITLRADYDGRHASKSANVNDSCVLQDPISGNNLKTPMAVAKSYSVGVNYLSISILPNYRFNNLFFFAGPTVSIPVSRNVTETNTITGETGCYYLSPGPDTTKSITGSLTDNGNSNTRFSVKLGVGYLFNVGTSIDLVPQLGLDLGLNRIFKNDETLEMVNSARPEGTSVPVVINRNIRLNSLQASIGVRVYL